MRTPVLGPIALLFALALSACATTSEPAGPVTAFVGVNVVPMTDSTTVLPDQTVLVRGGTITAVGPRARVRVPPGGARIDGSGKYLVPGLADMHVHLEHLQNPDILKLFVAHGITTVRSMDGRPFILEWSGAVERGEIVGPRIVTAGPILDGSPPLRDDNLTIASPEEAATAVLEQHRAGYDFIKVYTNLAPAAYRSAVATAEPLGMHVAGHVPRRIPIAEAARAQDSIEHLADFGRELDARPPEQAGKWHWSKMFLAVPLDRAKLGGLAQQLAAAGTAVVPTLIERERAAAPADQVERWRNQPEMQSVPADAVEQWLDQLRSTGERMDDEDWKLIALGRQNRLALVAAFHGAGARLLAGTDTPNAFVVPGSSLHEELVLLVEAGLSPGEALLAATHQPAHFLGLSANSGTVEPGKEADLILLRSNPLQDIAATRSLEGVMLRGRWIAGAELPGLAAALVDSQR